MRIAVVDLDVLVRNWWMILLRGVAGILFGFVTFVAPGISLAVLVLLFGAYALVDGVLAIVSAIRHHGTHDRAWMHFFEGVAGVAAGVLTVLWPGITALALLYLIAAWALVTGVFELVAAVRLRKVLAHEWLFVLSGIASLAFGVLLLAFPGAGALGVLLWIGAYAIVSGALLVTLSFRLRSLGGTHHHTAVSAHGVA
jgi:uncharacterized membrane protein HdeD (DUF308 family)